MYTQVLGEADSLLVQVVDSVFRKRCNMGCNMEIWLCGNPNPNKGVYEFNLFIFLLLLFLPDVDSPYASKTVLQVMPVNVQTERRGSHPTEDNFIQWVG